MLLHTYNNNKKIIVLGGQIIFIIPAGGTNHEIAGGVQLMINMVIVRVTPTLSIYQYMEKMSVYRCASIRSH